MMTQAMAEPSSTDELEDDSPSDGGQNDQEGDKGDDAGENGVKEKKTPALSRKETKKLLRVNTKHSLMGGLNPMSAMMPGSPLLAQ